MARVAAALLLAALCACAAGGALAKPGLEAASNSTVGALLGAATPALEALEALRANKTAQAAQKLDGPAHQVLDFGAGISNGLAGAAAQILGPKARARTEGVNMRAASPRRPNPAPARHASRPARARRRRARAHP